VTEEELPPDWDPGPALPELEDLREEASESFFDRIRSGIDRRVTTGQLMDFSVPMLLDFLREIGALIFGLTTPASNRTDKENRDE
jgi:hypothetical protein